MVPIEGKRIYPHCLLVAAAIVFETCPARGLLLGELLFRANILCVGFGPGVCIPGQLSHAFPVPSLACALQIPNKTFRKALFGGLAEQMAVALQLPWQLLR